jgi:hypothetical protein
VIVEVSRTTKITLCIAIAICIVLPCIYVQYKLHKRLWTTAVPVVKSDYKVETAGRRSKRLKLVGQFTYVLHGTNWTSTKFTEFDEFYFADEANQSQLDQQHSASAFYLPIDGTVLRSKTFFAQDVLISSLCLGGWSCVLVLVSCSLMNIAGGEHTRWKRLALFSAVPLLVATLVVMALHTKAIDNKILIFVNLLTACGVAAGVAIAAVLSYREDIRDKGLPGSSIGKSTRTTRPTP